MAKLDYDPVVRVLSQRHDYITGAKRQNVEQIKELKAEIARIEELNEKFDIEQEVLTRALTSGSF